VGIQESETRYEETFNKEKGNVEVGWLQVACGV